MKKINQFFRTADTCLVVLIFTLVSIALSAVVPLLGVWGVHDIHFNPTPDEQDMGFEMLLIFSVVFAPALETLFFQFIPFWLLSRIRWMRKNPIWIVLIPSLLFGISHNYTIHYMICAFIAGMVFMYVYIIRSEKQPFFTVAIIHALSNLFAVVMNEYYPNLIS